MKGLSVACVDDEELVLNLSVQLCKETGLADSVYGFSDTDVFLEWLKTNNIDIALLDIDMPKMSGIVLASKIKTIQPETSIMFLTGYSQYAVEAFSIHASGYLLKPISKEKLKNELEFIIQQKGEPYGIKKHEHIEVKTFGNFDIFVDGEAVSFKRSKAKEILAYLVDRQGSNVTRAEIFSALWEDEIYDRSKQKQLDVIIRSLKNTLKENGISEILEIKKGNLRVKNDMISCDLYEFVEGNIRAINSFRGEYMSSYYWAEMTEAYLVHRL